MVVSCSSRLSASSLFCFSLFSSFHSSFSSPLSGARVYRNILVFQPKVRPLSVAGASVEESNSSDNFFAEEGVSWKSLGISGELSSALTAAGLERPSLVQAACIPHILSGVDVVIAAETGSGKTHGYLAPLIDKLCVKADVSKDSRESRKSIKSHKISLVLCPNMMLCEQVVRMANTLQVNNVESQLSIAAVGGHQGWPVLPPDILISTPVSLLNSLFALDAEKRRRVEFLRDVKHVVFDEADMLLCGGFQNQVIRLINMFRFEEKVLSRLEGSQDEASTNPNDQYTEEDPEYDEDFEHLSVENELDDEICSDHESKKTKGIGGGHSGRKDWRRVRKVYTRSKQYIFVAATLPESGKKTAGGILKRMFPDAHWVSGSYLHCHNPRLRQRWIEVTIETQVDALIEAVKQGFMSNKKLLNLGDGVSRTMVFANTVEAVESVASILQRVGIHCITYHGDSSLEERTKNLADFRETGGVLVCTDAAARGLDVPNVSHVIQAEFATSAVDFLHRVGRTARAGQPGCVTCLYTESNRDLVNAVRQAGKLGQPMEEAFSRKRSFRNKLKKGLRVDRTGVDAAETPSIL